MKARKYFYLHSEDGKSYEKLNAKDLIRYGIPRSTAYRAIERGTLPRHKHRALQLKLFGELNGWKGWRILPDRIVSPTGIELDQIDIENLIYIKKILNKWFADPKT